METKSFNKTHTFIKRLADLVTFGVIAAKSGKEIQTAEAWGREPESNANPNGTGKKNPIDCVLRLIALGHEKDPGLAREIGDIFPEFVNFLDGKDGEQMKSTDSIHALIGCSVTEHTDVVLEILKSENPDWNKVVAEGMQSIAALNSVIGYAKGQLNNAGQTAQNLEG